MGDYKESNMGKVKNALIADQEIFIATKLDSNSSNYTYTAYLISDPYNLWDYDDRGDSAGQDFFDTVARHQEWLDD